MGSLIRLTLAVAALLAVALAPVRATPAPDADAVALPLVYSSTLPDPPPDRLHPFPPGAVRLTGYLGRRVEANRRNRLATVDEARLLAAFRQRGQPGAPTRAPRAPRAPYRAAAAAAVDGPWQQAWIGEHAGKWLDAASRAWLNSEDPALRARLDRVATGLVRSQEPDGYLGTYLAGRRFGLEPGAEWDVWVHKYGLLGLLAYWQATRDGSALTTAQKAAALLGNTYGPGQKSLLAAGTHAGKAATSVLEAMVLLHRATGADRYMQFSRYLRQALDDAAGPELLKGLQAKRPVSGIANAKAYELLSNLVGLCELARETGDRKLLEPVAAAWEDIVARRLYVTGTTSAGEHFRGDHPRPNNNAAHVGETCVTVTWLQLNAQLLRLTAEARFAEQIERTVYNHLLGAQRPDGVRWCVYTPLQGGKPYLDTLCCCLSSGPRGVAMLPELAWFRLRRGAEDAVCVNLYERGHLRTRLGGQPVTLEQATDYPASGQVRLTVRTTSPTRFGLRLRVPTWSQDFIATLLPAGTSPPSVSSEQSKIQNPKSKIENGWLDLPTREWRDGDAVEIRFGMAPRLVAGEPANPGRAAAQWGPLVLALEERAAGGDAALLQAAFAGPAGKPTDQRVEVWRYGGVDEKTRPTSSTRPHVHDPLARVPPTPPDLRFTAHVQTGAAPRPAVLVPFAGAGQGGTHFRVWLRAPGAAASANPSLLAGGMEGRSRIGGGWGEIIDGDPSTFAGTRNGRGAAEDWFSVSLRGPVTLRRIVFMHGQAFPHGGWFDAAAGRPRIQAVRAWGGKWEDVASLAAYPATTASQPAGLRPGQPFTIVLPQPLQALALRVIGRPAGGNAPQQPFATCAELQAFAK